MLPKFDSKNVFDIIELFSLVFRSVKQNLQNIAYFRLLRSNFPKLIDLKNKNDFGCINYKFGP